MNKTEKSVAYFKSIGVRFLDAMPEGWKELSGATTAPHGYMWVWNGKSPFRNVAEYRSALLKV